MPTPAQKRRHSLRLLVPAAVLAALLHAATATADPLERAVESILSKGGRKRARVGVHVVAAASGRVIYSRRPMGRFIAASNEKLVTAAAALEALGPDYQFRTRLYAAGPIQAGVLRGDLLVQGGADPTIGGRYDDEQAEAVFARWAEALKTGGVRSIKGDVVADDRFLDRRWYHPRWSKNQAWKWYFPPTSALSVNDNCVVITVKPGPAPGEPARLSLSPPVAPVELANLCTTSASKHSIWFSRKAGEQKVRIGGHVIRSSAGWSHRATVPNPPLYAAALLKSTLEQNDISVGGRPRLVRGKDQPAPTSSPPLCVRRARLLPVLRRMVRRSHNHYAEQVIKTIGAEAVEEGSWEAGLRRAGQMLQRMGFRPSEFQLDDGSGLSRRNQLSPALLTALLVRMRRSDHAERFGSLLGVPGEPGTLHDRLTDLPYRESVRAKTGYLNGVGALSGYATARSGIEVAFSVLVNDSKNPSGTYSMSATVDAICRAIVDHAE